MGIDLVSMQGDMQGNGDSLGGGGRGEREGGGENEVEERRGGVGFITSLATNSKCFPYSSSSTLLVVNEVSVHSQS